jgi:D-alanyl-D-alanine dipeptidase
MKQYALRFIWLGLSIFLICPNLKSQPGNNYPKELNITWLPKQYGKQIKHDTLLQFVDLQQFIPDLVLDIRYASSNNFTGKVVYPQARAFIRYPVAIQLKAIQKELKSKGMGLKIYDAYRPYSVSVKFFEIYPDSNFVANPRKGSRHNRGAAVYLSLVDFSSGQELEMPSQFDEFTERAHSGYTGGNATARKNRDLLINLMHQHGFIVYESEWWHFDFVGWQKFSLMDLSFDQLDSIKTRLNQN